MNLFFHINLYSEHKCTGKNKKGIKNVNELDIINLVILY